MVARIVSFIFVGNASKVGLLIKTNPLVLFQGVPSLLMKKRTPFSINISALFKSYARTKIEAAKKY